MAIIRLTTLKLQKVYLIVILLLISVFQLRAQESEADSLRTELKTATNAENKNEIYIKLLGSRFNSTYENADQLVKGAVANFNSIENADDDARATLFRQIGVYYSNRRELNKSNIYLDKVLESSTEGSETYCAALYAKGVNYRYQGEFEKCVQICLKADKHLEKANFIELRSNVLGLIASAYRSLGENQKSLGILKRNLKLLDGANHHKGINFTLTGIGRTFHNMAMYDSALLYHQKALEQGISTKDKRYEAICYNNMGNVFETKGDFNKALEFYIKSLELKQEFGEAYSISIAHFNVGSIKLSMEKYEDARLNFEKSLTFASSSSNKIIKIRSILKIGKIYSALGPLDSAIYYHRRGLDESRKIKFNNGIIEACLDLGKDMMKAKRLEESYSLYTEALEVARLSKNKSDESAALIGIAQLYLAQTDDESQLISEDKAEQLLNEAYNVSSEQENMQNVVTSLYALRAFYEAKGDFKNQSFYAEKYIKYRDSLYKIQNADAIAQWETKYESAEKDKEIELLEKDGLLKDAQARRRRLLAIAFAILAIVIGIIGFSFYNQLKLRQKLRMERFRNKVAADLHDDVGSTLSSIAMYSEVIKQKAQHKLPEALPMLDNMSSSSKELMEAMSDIVWTINPKNNSIASLLTRVKHQTAELCEAKEIQFSFTGDSHEDVKMDMDAAQNVYLVIKEAVNNSLKYSKCSTLCIETSLQDKVFCFDVKDNGSGFDLNDNSIGNGMRTMRERMEDIGGTLKVRSSDQGTTLIGSLSI